MYGLWRMKSWFLGLSRPIFHALISSKRTNWAI